MTSQNILTADVLDIVFENRNKAYGAYNLRKYYDQRLTKSLIATLLVVTALLLLSFKLSKKTVTSNKINKDTVVIKTYELKPEEKKEPEKPKEKPAEQPKANNKDFETFKNNTVQIVDDIKVLDKDTMVDNNLLDTRANGNETKNGEKGGQELVNRKAATDSGDGGPEKTEVVIDVNIPIEYADTPPTYPGGIEALQNFLRRNLRTPDELESGQIASVKIKFIVGNEGEMYGYEVVQSAGDVFDDEVIRVLKKMPKWIPGKYKGQAVTTYFVIPVKFEAIEE